MKSHPVSTNISHSKKEACSFLELVSQIKKRIIERGNLPHASIEKQLEVVDRLTEFEFGRFLLERKGANGYWTDVIMDHPNKGKVTGLDLEGNPYTPIEDYILNRSPIVLATQHRFQIFQEELQKLLKDNIVLASIPCGLMRDLITLDYSNVSNYKIYGVDIDQESLDLAKKFADKTGIIPPIFRQGDAWNLGLDGEIDVLTSNGLNVYEPDENKVIELYKEFYTALKPEGTLIIGVLTYPPSFPDKTEWVLDEMSDEDLLMSEIVYKDVLDLQFWNFRTSEEIVIEFKKAGFKEVSLIYDKYKAFPTVIATK